MLLLLACAALLSPLVAVLVTHAVRVGEDERIRASTIPLDSDRAED